MKLVRRNKYSNQIISGISTILVAMTILSGCSSDQIIEYIETQNPVNTPYEDVISSEVIATSEPTTIPNISTEEDDVISSEVIATSEPTTIPSISTEEDDVIAFKRLTEEEEKEAVEKLGIIDYDEILTYGDCYSANLYIDGKPKVVFGRVSRISNDGEYLFKDLFTSEDLFVYKTTNKDNLSVTWSSYSLGPLEFTPIHPYFSGENCELRFVDYAELSINFLMECGLDLEDEDNLAYMFEFLPSVIYSEDEVSITEMAHIYLNIIPKPLWVTNEDLELAKGQQVKTLG